MKVVLAIAVALAAIATAHAEVRRIRLCADPSNLPFSSQRETEPGFEVEVARAAAQALGAEFSVHWFPTAREILALRQLYEGRCDVFMGVPLTPAFRDDKPRLLFTIPYYVMRQVVVSPTVGGASSLDALRGKLVGVQAMTLGDQLVHERGLIRKVQRTPEELFTALVGGDVDGVVIESPLAGWFVARNPGFRVVEVNDPGREFPIGAAVRKTDAELKAQLDRTFAQLEARTLPDILARYGIGAVRTAAAAAAPAPLSQELRFARSTYLTQCSQCHGPDGKGTALPSTNLQAFKGSEDDFLRVVRNGRTGTPMVPWKGLIPDEDIRLIASYLKQLSADTARQ